MNIYIGAYCHQNEEFSLDACVCNLRHLNSVDSHN